MVPEYAEGEILGYVVVTWPQMSPDPDIDTPGLHWERETAELELAGRQKHTASVGRGERHEIAAVVRLEEEGDE